MQKKLDRFDPSVPIERALTPPASWYIDPDLLELERRTVLREAWQPAARLEQLQASGDYVAGELAGEPYIVLRDGNELRGFFNVCRHHASHLAGDIVQPTRLGRNIQLFLKADHRTHPQLVRGAEQPCTTEMLKLPRFWREYPWSKWPDDAKALPSGAC